jgi:hypothetical protein
VPDALGESFCFRASPICHLYDIECRIPRIWKVKNRSTRPMIQDLRQPGQLLRRLSVLVCEPMPNVNKLNSIILPETDIYPTITAVRMMELSELQ